MPYNPSTGAYERDPNHVADASPGGDTTKQGVVDVDAAVNDGYNDLEHHRQHEKHGVEGDVVGTTDVQTLSNKTLAQPTISDFTNMQHDHSSAAQGGALLGVPTSDLGKTLVAHEAAADMRATLGLGTAATADSDAFADAGHTHAYSALTGKPTLGTASAEDIGTGDTNVPTVATVKSLSSKPHAPQSIVQASLGSLPAGWVAGDCDLPVVSMTASGGVVTIATGLQVAYAESGSVRLSALSSATQSVDLSGQADGTYHVAVNLNADGSFAAPSFSAVRPEAGISRVAAGADIYNNATVTMLDSSDAPIRRVYLGFAVISSGVVTDVVCYALGDIAVIPVNNGSNIASGSNVYQSDTPYIGRMSSIITEIYATPISAWAEGGFFTDSAASRFTKTTQGNAILYTTTGATALIEGNSGYSGTRPIGQVITSARSRVVVKRGY